MKAFLLITAFFTATIGFSQSSTGTQLLTWQGMAAVGGYEPEGTLEILEASAEISEDEIKSLSIVVDMRTLEQENTQLRDHLREEDFFYIEKFPVATFVLKETMEEGTDIILSGDMTIRGVTVREQILAQVKIQDDRVIISFDHTMDRTDYGIVYNSLSVFKRLKDNAIADEFKLKGEIKIDR